MINSEILNPLLLSAFNQEITWFEASARFPLDEFIDTFYRIRERTRDRVHVLFPGEHGATNRFAAGSEWLHTLSTARKPKLRRVRRRESERRCDGGG